MLYEVITPGIFYLFTFPELQLINRNQQYETLLGEQATIASNQHFLSPLLANANSIIDMPPGKMNQSEQIMIETELCNRNRITSYNVCYTKLLRPVLV